MQTRRDPIVFLVDVDNTLLDNDGIQQDLKDHIEQVYGCAARLNTRARSSCCRCPRF